MRNRGSSHRLVDHTSELVIRLVAPGFTDLVVEAGRAFSTLVPAHLGGVQDPTVREIEVESRDPEGALVAWLNELVYLAEAERWVPTHVDASVEEGPSGVRLHVRARGRTLEHPFVLVKAATLHGLALRDTPEGVTAEVTLDI